MASPLGRVRRATPPALRLSRHRAAEPTSTTAGGRCYSASMASPPLEVGAPAAGAVPTSQAALDEAIATTRDRAWAFARLAPWAKAGMVRECIPRLLDVAPEWV